MTYIGRWGLFLVSLPQALLISYPAVLLAWAFRVTWRPRFESHGVLVATKRRTRKYSQTLLGPGILLTELADDKIPGLDSPVEVHETRHIAQIQVLAFGFLVTGFALYLCGAVTISTVLALWFFGPVVTFLGGYVCGFAESGRFYLGSEFERSAYAQRPDFLKVYFDEKS